MVKQKNTDYFKKYPWLEKYNTVEEYIQPDYYDSILKNYSFQKKDDLEYFQEYASRCHISKALELGSGSGRATEIFLHNSDAPLEMVDLSKRMLEYTSNKFKNRKSISYVNMDALEYMYKTKEIYDFVYTLWSFSHSVHQHVQRLGFSNAKSYVSKVINKFIFQNLALNGSFFLIHFDSMSQEQKILMRQWKRVNKRLKNINQQSLSKRMLDDIFHNIDNRGLIRLSIQHLKGDTIYYKSAEELLEVFMNFHLETFFNRHKLLPTIIKDITKQIEQYRQVDGTYRVDPGCYIYTLTKS
ncbi:MAG: class I SAM-dependent methyltransferase [Candidatus Staskawiczbacteria bacterium]|nr:class I SAM-dependent methyltransferase [Candidatus Staskawiczbacteria bacterium]